MFGAHASGRPLSLSPGAGAGRSLVLALALLLLASPCADAAGSAVGGPDDDDSGDPEASASLPSIPYHAFLKKFQSRIDHSPTALSHKEVFNLLDVNMDKQVSNEEMKRFRKLVPPPAMTRDHFVKKFGKQGKFAAVPTEMIHQAFDLLDQDGDGNLDGSHETDPIKKTLEKITDQFNYHMKITTQAAQAQQKNAGGTGYGKRRAFAKTGSGQTYVEARDKRSGHLVQGEIPAGMTGMGGDHNEL